MSDRIAVIKTSLRALGEEELRVLSNYGNTAAEDRRLDHIYDAMKKMRQELRSLAALDELRKPVDEVRE